jgi:hypothetical protein
MPPDVDASRGRFVCVRRACYSPPPARTFSVRRRSAASARARSRSCREQSAGSRQRPGATSTSSASRGAIYAASLSGTQSHRHTRSRPSAQRLHSLSVRRWPLSRFLTATATRGTHSPQHAQAVACDECRSLTRPPRSSPAAVRAPREPTTSSSPPVSGTPPRCAAASSMSAGSPPAPGGHEQGPWWKPRC